MPTKAYRLFSWIPKAVRVELSRGTIFNTFTCIVNLKIEVTFYSDTYVSDIPQPHDDVGFFNSQDTADSDPRQQVEPDR